MKKFLIYVLLFLVIMLPAAAQSVNLTEFQAGFEGFATAFANTLPFNALIGQNWADAFIGSFPHLGVGATVGATTIPFEAVKPVFDLFSITLPPDLSFLMDLGVPVPAYTVDARLGIPFLPMDAGVKFGWLPEDIKTVLPANLSLDYLLAGVDVRYCLLKSNVLLPDISIGAGYSYLRGSFGISGLLGTNPEIANVAGHTISLTDPALNFNWETSVIDLKVQVSKNLLFVTPYIGAGASYGISSAGGGLESDVLFDGTALTQADIDLINTVLGAEAPDLSSQGITVSSENSGWSARIFGGIGLNIVIVHLDVGVMFNLTSLAYGGAINLRVQL